MKLEESWKIQLYTNLNNRLKTLLDDIAQNCHRVQTILTRMADADGEKAFNLKQLAHEFHFFFDEILKGFCRRC